MRKIIWLYLFQSALPIYIFAQTCCSAGTPILSAINVSAINLNQWQFSLTIEHNSIKDVLPQSLTPREERFTNSVILDISYGINDRFSTTLIMPYVQLSQTPLFGSEGETKTSRVGDVLALIKYNILTSNIADQRQMAIGYGLKFPSGKSNVRGRIGAILPPQLQPGTGSWDHVLWAFLSQSFRPSPYSVFTNISYRINGKNNRFQINGPFSSYHFGDVFSLISGLSYRLSPLVDLSFQGSYRHTSKDLFGDSQVLNTGGDWIYIIPALNLNFDPYGFRFSGKLPVYRDLSGIQITTSFTVSGSFYFFIL